MGEIGILLAVIVVMAALWMADRRRWKQKIGTQKNHHQECRKQAEKSDAQMADLKKELVRVSEENQKLRVELRHAQLQRERQRQELADQKHAYRKSLMKIHLYTQLVQEQIQTDTAQKLCHRIIKECEEKKKSDGALENDKNL